jgi:Fe2+ transport system protein FeoA
LDKLVNFDEGETVVIRKIDTTGASLKTLKNFGMNSGTPIRIVRKSVRKNPVVINCLETEVAISHGLALKIFAERI